MRSHANTVPNTHVHATYETEKHILRTLDVIQHEPGSDWCYCDGSCYMPIVSNPSLSPRATTPLWFLKCFSLRQLHTHDPVQRCVRAHWVCKSGEITHRRGAEGSPGAEDGTLGIMSNNNITAQYEDKENASRPHQNNMGVFSGCLFTHVEHCS